MARVSRKIVEARKLSHMRSYQIAQAAQMHPSTLSRLLCGIEPVKKDDPRVVKIGKVLGLRPDECFE